MSETKKSIREQSKGADDREGVDGWNRKAEASVRAA